MNGYGRIQVVLRESMDRDPSVRVLSESLSLAADTAGLKQDYPERVYQLPAADSAMIGVATGMAIAGIRPVLCLHGPSSLCSLLPQLVQELGGMGEEFVPKIVIRVPFPPDAALPLKQLGALDGIVVACPSSPEGLAGVLEAALRSAGTTIVLERQDLYGQRAREREASDLRSAELLEEGTDVTVAAWGAGVAPALKAAAELTGDGFRIEVIDLRIINPLDREALAQSIKKTGRAVLVQPPAGTLDAVLREAFWMLESPPQSPDANSSAIRQAIEETLRY
jgi:pyruvate/2-oxoglutarate/acetoin dehydrogenase E1 component